MTIEEFWNQAFIACLTRLPVDKAKKEADSALNMCIKHWDSNKEKYTPFYNKWQNQNVGGVFIPVQGAQSKNFPGYLDDDK
ncbi:hypothetical protein [Pectobacterium aroidearum]|uniref:hypothetical protein n=1 Tax=Pectobacterium aroidearum TaxID=1201031 RepID=UPI002A83C663|nr:hypothetical protein [Pectobacterium aroidearum]MDY4386411.1 hypothetical protein [Pectobacterium aroidearum]